MSLVYTVNIFWLVWRALSPLTYTYIHEYTRVFSVSTWRSMRKFMHGIPLADIHWLHLRWLARLGSAPRLSTARHRDIYTERSSSTWPIKSNCMYIRQPGEKERRAQILPITESTQVSQCTAHEFMKMHIFHICSFSYFEPNLKTPLIFCPLKTIKNINREVLHLNPFDNHFTSFSTWSIERETSSGEIINSQLNKFSVKNGYYTCLIQ